MDQREMNNQGSERTTQTEWVRELETTPRILVWATRCTEILVTKSEKTRKGCGLGGSNEMEEVGLKWRQFKVLGRQSREGVK